MIQYTTYIHPMAHNSGDCERSSTRGGEYLGGRDTGRGGGLTQRTKCDYTAPPSSLPLKHCGPDQPCNQPTNQSWLLPVYIPPKAIYWWEREKGYKKSVLVVIPRNRRSRQPKQTTKARVKTRTKRTITVNLNR